MSRISHLFLSAAFLPCFSPETGGEMTSGTTVDPAVAAQAAANGAAAEETATQQIAASKNQEMIDKLLNAPQPLLAMKEYNITFRKDATLGTKRDSFKIHIPIPTFVGIVEALAKEGKERDYIVNLVEADIYAAARAQINDHPEKLAPLTQDQIDVGKLTLEYLANLPPAERRGGGIAKEVWEEFAADYIAVMPALLPTVPVDKISNAAQIFLKKFQTAKTNKAVLKVLRGYLAKWFENSPNKEDFVEVYQFLDGKAEEFLNQSEESLLSGIM